MHAYKTRTDSAYVPRTRARAQVAAISDTTHIAGVDSPALALQDELVRRLAGAGEDRLSPGLSVAVIISLGLLGWMPVVAAGWALLG